RVRRADELFRIGARAVFEARLETVGRVLEHAGLGGDGAATFLQTSLPERRTLLDHGLLSNSKHWWMRALRSKSLGNVAREMSVTLYIAPMSASNLNFCALVENSSFPPGAS